MQNSGFGFAGGASPLRRFDAMVHGIPDQVHQRIADLFQHRLVEFGVFSRQAQFHLLAQFLAEIVHQARKAVEGKTDGEHANTHDAFLQFARISLEIGETVAQALERRLVERIEVAAADLAQHRLGDDQFADDIDQGVDLVDANPDRARFGAAGFRASRLLPGGDGNIRRTVCRLVPTIRRRDIQRLDIQFTVALHPLEDFVDLLPGNLATQHQGPAQACFLG